MSCLVTYKQCQTLCVNESRNPNLALLQICQSHGVLRTSKSSISCFSVFGLVCCFASYCGVALVSWFL
jgi:hypothetical protein